MKNFMEVFWEWVYFICTIFTIFAAVIHVGELFGDIWILGVILYGIIYTIAFYKKSKKRKDIFRERLNKLTHNPLFNKFSEHEMLQLCDEINSINKLNDSDF